MHTIEPYASWSFLYDPSKDERSPFYGKEYNYDLYSETIYGYYIDPAWDYLGSETLYLKVLFADYQSGFVIMEFIGEWNDALNNDIMHLKRNVIDDMLTQGIKKFILIGENVFNFHGSDDSYYEEWFEDTEDGWVVAIGFREFIQREWQLYDIDSVYNFGGNLELGDWRTMSPKVLFDRINEIMSRRLRA